MGMMSKLMDKIRGVSSTATEKLVEATKPREVLIEQGCIQCGDRELSRLRNTHGVIICRKCLKKFRKQGRKQLYG
jgi:ribosomal protein L37AE/L43A